MITAKDYIEQYPHDEAEKAAWHRAYYAQFVTEETKDSVISAIGKETLLASTDKHLNDIALWRWDRLTFSVPINSNAAAAAGLDRSLGNGVCILKEAARQIIEKHQQAA